MDEVLVLTDQAQAKALFHPLRQRILGQLEQGQATPSEVARAIGIAASKAHYHVRVLEKAGLVRVAETRSIGGVTETRFVRTAERYILKLRNAEGQTDHAGSAWALGRIFDDLWHNAQVILEQGQDAVDESHLLTTVLGMKATTANQHMLEDALATLRTRFASTVQSRPAQKYWLMLAWVPQQVSESSREE